jgi:hypothetical protein
MDVCAEHKHERLVHAFMNDTAERNAVDVDAGLAPRIIVTELYRL